MKKLLSSFLLFSILFAFSTFSAESSANSLSDLDSEDPSLTAIESLYQNNVINGYEDGTFRSTNTINRAEFVKIMVGSVMENPTGSNCFPDVKEEWFAKYVCTAKEKGWISGYSDGHFRPGDSINFAEASKILVNAFELEKSSSTSPWYRPYVEALSEQSAIPSSIGDLDKYLMRGEMAEVIWRLKENVTNEESLSYEEVEGNLIRLNSCEELEDQFLSEPYIYYYEEYAEDSDADTTSPSESSDSSTGASDYSSTNVQVAGVDEPDSVKNDGKYIYMVKDDSVRIIEAYPADSMQQVAELTYPETNFTPTALALNDDQLIVIGEETNEDLEYPFEFETQINLYYHAYRTGVYIYDVSDAAEPSLTRHLSLDGYYDSARRIGDDLYLIMHQNDFSYYGYDYDPETIHGEEVLPRFFDSMTGEEDFIAPCSSVRYLPHQTDLEYVIAAAIPLDDETPIDAQVLIGSSENVYASQENLYIASTNYDSSDYYYDWTNTKTLIHRFSLGDGDIDYQNSGKVKGTIVDQFSMDEHEGYFRIATTIGHAWDSSNPPTNNIYILDDDLNTVGSLENLAEGETIYSTRFLGDTGYMVTFKKVDPLFTFDLSDPKNPVVLGELKIPGYSDYLHPYDETHLIGFGKDAEDASKEEIASRDLDFAWYQGMKVSLFDVSDLSNPKQLFSIGIGDRGTYSQLLDDHKALLFSEEKNLLAFPIEVAKVEDENASANTYGEAVFQGAYVYNLSLEDGFELKGTDTHHEATDSLDYYSSSKDIQRIIYIGNTLYTISESAVHALDLDSMEEENTLDL